MGKRASNNSLLLERGEAFFINIPKKLLEILEFHTESIAHFMAFVKPYFSLSGVSQHRTRCKA